MGETNFSRKFQFVPGGSDASPIRDIIFPAVDYVEDRGPYPREQAIRDQIQYVFKTLSEDLVLPIPKRRKDFAQTRKAWSTLNNGSETDMGLLHEALRSCPHSQELICDIYLKRATLYYQASRFDWAREDLQEALGISNARALDVESEVVFRMHHKLAQACAKLKRYSEAVEALKEAQAWLQECEDFASTEKESFRVMLEESIRKFAKKSDGQSGDSAHNPKGKKCLVLEEPHQDNPALSQAIEIQIDPTRGRHAVAVREISCGEIVALDQPVVSILNPDDSDIAYAHCHHCLSKCSDHQVFCPECQTVFCSSGCRAQEVHRFECAINLAQIRAENVSDSFRIFLTWRAAILMGGTRFKELFHALETGVGQPKTDEERLFHMETHTLERDLSGHIKYVVLALFVYRLLEQGKAIPTLEEPDWDLAAAIHHILQVQDVNTHPLLGLSEDHRSSEVGLNKIGNALNANIASFVNHSCNPNTCRINVGIKSFLVATRTIPRGEEISDIYSMHYSEIPKGERARWLREMFFFHCQCRACQEDWPVYDALSGKVPDERLMQELRQVETGIFQALKKRDFATALALHAKDVKLLEAQLQEPHRLFVSVRNSLQFCLWKYLNHRNTR